MDLTELRKERERHWKKLDLLLKRVEKNGLESLSAEEVRKLGSLYRLTVSSYSVLKGLSLDRKLIHYLHNLITRAYLVLYHYDDRSKVKPLRFFTDLWPALVRKHWIKFVISAVTFCLAVFVSLYSTWNDRQLTNVLMPSSVAQGRNSFSSRQELMEVLRSGRGMSGSKKSMFASFLFRHNTQIGILSFGSGILGGVPAVALGVYNGVILGALAGLYHSHDIGYEFWGWVLPHGVTELLAVILCVQAGLIIGMAVVKSGEYRWRDAVARAGKEAGLIVLGTVLMFFVAALIEAFLRQTSISWQARHSFSIFTFALWVLYFGFAGDREEVDKMEEHSESPHVKRTSYVSEL